MRLFSVLLGFLMIAGISAQGSIQMETLSGDWKIKSFIREGKPFILKNTYFRYSVSDVDDFLLDQVLTENNREKCSCTAMIHPPEKNVIFHDLLMCSDEEDGNPVCIFSIAGDYTYEFRNHILYLSNTRDKIELERK